MSARNGFGRQARISAQGGKPPADSKGVRVQTRSRVARVGAFLRSRNEGQALVEIAIALPLLLILLTGIFTFGIAYINEMTLQSAVGSAAQLVAVSRGSSTDPCAPAYGALKAAAPNFNATNLGAGLTVTVNGTASTKGETACATDLGTTYGASSGKSVSVSATYPCTIGVYGRNFAPTCQLAATVSELEY